MQQNVWHTKGRQQRQNQQTLTPNSQNHKGLSEQERSHTHTHTSVKNAGKKLAQKEETNLASHKGKDLCRCTKVEETVRRR